MNNQVINGWLLHKRPHGDTSWDLIIFTKQHGKIDALYRGGRILKKNTNVQLFTALTLSVQQAYQRFYINKIELINWPYELQDEALYCGWYINELLTYLLPIGYHNEAFFELYEDTLQTLQNANTRIQLAQTLRKFERSLILTAGLSFAAEGLPDKIMQDIMADMWDDPATLQAARKLFRKIIDDLLNGRELNSRKLWQQNVFEV